MPPARYAFYDADRRRVAEATLQDRRLSGLLSDAPGMTPKMLRLLEGIALQELVRRLYDRGRVRVNDACASCTSRIRLAVEDAQLVLETTELPICEEGVTGTLRETTEPGKLSNVL
ncbi:MAG: hypothetical protein ACK45F_10550 [bacterium]